MTQRRAVVVTGAAGRIGTAVTERLSDRWDIRGQDLPGHGVEAFDATDLESCRRAFDGADAVVHLAADPDPEAGWEELLPANVVAAWCVATAAMEVGVRRLVLASSVQAMSAVADHLQVRARDAPRPANLYGATKAWAEAVGSWVANSSTVEVVALRIGYFGDRPAAEGEGSVLQRASWLSPDDCAELVRAAVEGPVDGFTVVSGVSANRYRRAEHGEVEVRLGYEPRDDAWADD
jgi:uronate dehydrogenase